MKLKEAWATVSIIIWGIQVRVLPTPNGSGQEEICPVHLILRRSASFTDPWEVDISDLEAVLGLWVWSLKSSEASNDPVPSRRLFSFSESHGERQQPTEDFTLWVCRGRVALEGNTQNFADWESAPKVASSGATLNGVRYFGWQALGFISDPLLLQESSHMPLYIETKETLEKLCAQDIYLSFITAVAAILRDVGGETHIRDPFTEGQMDLTNFNWMPEFTLLNTNLDKMATAFVDSGLGSRQDAYMCIIPPLSMHSKLPRVSEVVQETRNVTAKWRREHKWQLAEKFLNQATFYYKMMESRYTVVAQRDLGELYRAALRSGKSDAIQFGFDGVSSMCKVLFSWEENPNIYYRYRWIATQIATEAGLNKFLNRLDVNIKDNWVRDPPFEGTTFMEAVKDGNLEAALLLIDRNGQDVLERDEGGRDAMSWAAQHNFSELVEALIERNIDPDTEDSDGRTPLSYAAEHGNADLLDLLLAHGASPAGRDSFRRSLLHWASLGGHESVVRRLVSTESVELDFMDKSGGTPLLLAVGCGHSSVVDCLINSHVKVTDEALFRACKFGSIDVVLLLLGSASPGAPSPLDGIKGNDDWTNLMFSTNKGRAGEVRKILKRGSVVNGQIEARIGPMEIAAWRGHEDVMAVLFEEGFTVDATNDRRHTALMLATRNRKARVVDLLLARGADPTRTNEAGETALHIAAEKGDIDIVEMLCSHGVDIDAWNNDYNTPLHIAAVHDSCQAASFLLSKAASLEAQNTKQQTPLHVAALYKAHGVMELLVRAGADLEARDEEDETALHLAVAGSWTSGVELLIGAGSDLEAAGSRGTPLTCVVARKDEEQCKLLRGHGARVDARVPRDFNRTCLHLAAEKNDISLAEWLIGEGADLTARDANNMTVSDLAEALCDPYTFYLFKLLSQ
ncbi:ankyrin repeat-containing domain protein [Durotheca rogersii]|uniref:ankyrin repeat-containing domain protein n=1 Tax=Durotheca rogersii TaxID=419775 RepID=UPI00221F8115|nr:ankyrin repeat-containing domain protein [Durotheca rogersii]KAI5862621.1 ankyrin repeat-containing domain protein [Durotheca rogersii]